MALEMISWPIPTKECCRTLGLNPRPFACQAAVHTTELPGPAQQSLVWKANTSTTAPWLLLHMIRANIWYHWTYLPPVCFADGSQFCVVKVFWVSSLLCRHFENIDWEYCFWLVHLSARHALYASCNFWTVHARVVKFHILILYGKITERIFFLVWVLPFSGVMPLLKNEIEILLARYLGNYLS